MENEGVASAIPGSAASERGRGSGSGSSAGAEFSKTRTDDGCQRSSTVDSCARATAGREARNAMRVAIDFTDVLLNPVRIARATSVRGWPGQGNWGLGSECKVREGKLPDGSAS